MTSPDYEAAADPAAENVLTALVEYLNAGDFESVAELLHEDVDCPFFDTAGAAGVVEGFADLALRYPAMVYTRGELGVEPVLVAWGFGREPGVHGREEGAFRRMAVLAFAFTDGDEPLIEHIAFDESPDPPADLLAEEPDPSELPEGVDWLEWDAGEAFGSDAE